MDGKFLLDTNIVIALFAEDSMVQEKLKKATQVFIPIVVLGELYFGARKSTRVDDNLKRIEEFAANNAVLSCDLSIAREYGRIKNMLKDKGRPIPDNDIWVAAIAFQNKLTLVSKDEHFSEIDDINIEVWR